MAVMILQQETRSKEWLGGLPHDPTTEGPVGAMNDINNEEDAFLVLTKTC